MYNAEGRINRLGIMCIDAYGVACKNGFQGTVEEWIESLKGADGVTPHIGDNGNWYIGETDTGYPSRGKTGQTGKKGDKGDPGQAGEAGKSAYEYAKAGGYPGTEEEFAAKLASTPDWNAADGEPGYIEGRTHYDYIGKVVEEVTINSSSQSTVVPEAHPIVIGRTYTVHWGDTDYVCEALDGSLMAPEGAGTPILGDYGVFSGTPVSGEPFIMLAAGGIVQVVGLGEDKEIPFSIDGLVSKTIPERFIPTVPSSYTLPINNDVFTSANNTSVSYTLDTTELVDALRRRIPIFVELIGVNSMARYNAEVQLVGGTGSDVESIEQLLSMFEAQGLSNAFPCEIHFGSPWDSGEKYRLVINMGD